MKKNIKISLLLSVICFIILGCQGKQEVNYSEFSFTDISWTRSGDVDTEYIRFSSNGEFSYYCACGNPVNDSDLCETYSYNDKTGIIKLKCFEKTDSMVTTIKVVDYDDYSIKLDFAGEIKEFIKE